MAKRHILILFHENANRLSVGNRGVSFLTPHWRDMGFRVTYQFGTGKSIPADLVFIHVDLSVVPEPYLEYADRYPLAINRRITDIRKSRISENLVTSSDCWEGPVIVKSDLNHGGHPDYILGGSGSRFSNVVTRKLATMYRARRFSRGHEEFRSSLDYRVYDHFALVPGEVRDDPGLVIEKFCPELESGHYVIRMYRFLGNRGRCRIMSSDNPLVKSRSKASYRYEPPPDFVKTWKEKFDIDYGKLDYVIHNGEPVLLDVNKTPGIGRAIPFGRVKREPQQEQHIKHRNMAEGIEAFFR